MAEGGGEDQHFGKSIQRGTKYGTNSRLTLKTSTYIKHTLTKSDTLQGLALKYGVTIEQIKRENKLWTNDSLFLREQLLIPVPKEEVQSLPEHLETVVIDPMLRTRSSSQKSNISDTEVLNNSSSNTPKPSSSSEVSGMDFLSKYDSSIAELKSNVKQMEKNARSLPFIEKADTYPRRKHSYPASSSHSSRKSSVDSNGQLPSFYDNSGYQGSDKDLTNSPVLMIKSKSSDRRVRSSLNRIQQQNDEIFEL